jgi:hypothetical protein
MFSIIAAASLSNTVSYIEPVSGEYIETGYIATGYYTTE